jgi:hypothetical protein
LPNCRELFQAYFHDEESVSTKLRELEFQKLRPHAKGLLHTITGKSSVPPPRGNGVHDESEHVPPSPPARAEEKIVLSATGFKSKGQEHGGREPLRVEGEEDSNCNDVCCDRNQREGRHHHLQ